MPKHFNICIEVINFIPYYATFFATNLDNPRIWRLESWADREASSTSMEMESIVIGSNTGNLISGIPVIDD
jgi:hypothetical protein